MALTKIKLNTGMVTGSLPDANIPDDITISGAQTGITSVGTLGSLTTSGSTGSNYIGSFTNTSATGWGLFVKGGADNADYALRVQDKDAGDLLSVKAGGRVGVLTNDPSHSMVIKTHSSGSVNVFKIEEKDSTDALVHASFANSHDEGSIGVYYGGTLKNYFRGNGTSYIKGGDLEVESDGARFFVKSATNELVSIGRAGSSGDALQQGYLRMKNAGTNTIALHSASNSYFTNGLSIGTSSMNSNATLHVRQNSSGQSSSSNNTQITVENNGSAGIQILTGTTNAGGLWVGDSNGSETGGKLYYMNGSDFWQFYNSGSVDSLNISTSMVRLFNADSGSAGSTLKQLSMGWSTSTYWDTTNTGTFVGMSIANAHNDVGVGCGIQFVTRSSSSGISYIVSRGEGSDASSLHFGTRGSDGVQRRMLIGSDGVVSINANSNNKASLNVVASGSGQAPNDAKIYVSKNSSNDWSFSGIGGGDDYGLKLNGAGSHAIYVTDHSQSSAARFKVQFNGYVYSTDGSIHDIDSDERKKEDIGLVESQWQMLKDLPLQKFKWKDRRAGDKYSYGWIAQDVQEKYPELVNIVPQSKEDIENEVEDPEYLTVMTGDIHRLAIKALQEAMAKIETLESKVKALENA